MTSSPNSPDPASPPPDPSAAPDANTPAPRLTLSYRQRIHSSRDFAAIYDAGRRAGDGHLLVFTDRNELGWSRYGLSVSRKHGNAVRRNRLRRLLRESFRLCQHELPAGYDFILIPRHNSGATLTDYCQSITIQARRAVNRSGKKTGPAGESQSASRSAPRKRGRGGQRQASDEGAAARPAARGGEE